MPCADPASTPVPAWTGSSSTPSPDLGLFQEVQGPPTSTPAPLLVPEALTLCSLVTSVPCQLRCGPDAQLGCPVLLVHSSLEGHACPRLPHSAVWAQWHNPALVPNGPTEGSVQGALRARAAPDGLWGPGVCRHQGLEASWDVRSRVAGSWVHLAGRVCVHAEFTALPSMDVCCSLTLRAMRAQNLCQRGFQWLPLAFSSPHTPRPSVRWSVSVREPAPGREELLRGVGDAAGHSELTADGRWGGAGVHV